IRALARRADLLFTAGVLVLAVGRVLSLRRGRAAIAAPLLLPAAVLACLLGLVVHQATFELTVRLEGGVRVASAALPSAAGFAGGFLLGCLAAAALLAAPVDLAALARRLQVGIAVFILAVFAALAVVGSGPGASGARINLGPIQPIEAVKPLFVVFLAAFLGARAAKLRWQRQRLLGLRWPRLELLVPAAAVLVLILAGLFLVGDLGPVIVLALVFLGIFFLVTRATGWPLVALGLVGAALLAMARWPGLVDVGRVATRIRMWRDPFTNALTHGHQLGEGLWAIAAGGPLGQGLAQASTPLVPAGKTDLVLATMMEQLGAAGLAAYLALLGVIALSGFRVAGRSRTSDRVLLAGGAALLLIVQWAVIHAGTLGLLPLTGIVVPFLSLGRSSMVAFLVVVALIARVAADGPTRAPSVELDELRRGTRGVAAVAAGLLVVGLAAGANVALRARDRISAQPILSRLRDGTLVSRPNPRLLAVAAQLRRGTLADRHGTALAVTRGGRRDYPLGAALGTLVGAYPSRVLLPPWALERVFDHRLRGYGERQGGPSVGSPPQRLAAPDLRPFVPLLALPPAERRRRVRALDDDIAARSVRLSLDARLQRQVAALLQRRVGAGRQLAAAAVVLDVDTGEVLARVQAPDLDPNDRGWQERLAARDAAFAPRFTGAYGAWPDKTGVQGHYQSGSVGKLFTALAAARRGFAATGSGCDARAAVEYECAERDAQGPRFTRPGWPRPVHDHVRDPIHGRLDLGQALAVSCNVYFGQLALALGPEPLRDLRRLGVEVGYGGPRPLDPGAAGSRQLASTGFGQGAMVMSVVQAARLVAALGAGGRYRRCPATLAIGAPCPEQPLVADPAAVGPILAGMRRVMTAGTGRGLHAPAGVRVYGKTGTADVRGFAGEAPFGITPAQPAAPHSWFVALAEPEAVPPCQLRAPGRLAVAVVVPRGGSGASAAGPLAMEILAALRGLGYLAPGR
ncbi:MAG TPA: FtsW/RodA/SpoVE family cell cycle protein, partial [Polyangia bacterium]